jgi:uncharacterized protein
LIDIGFISPLGGGMVDPMRRPFFLSLFLLSLAACSVPVEKAQPALWAVRDSDTTLYMLGTVHQLPANIDWDDGPVEQAIAASDTLFLELSPDAAEDVPAMFAALAKAAQPRDAGARVAPELAGKLSVICEDSGVPRDQIANYDDWAVTVLIGRAQAERAGLSPAYGVETILTARFTKAGKPVRGFETAAEQLMLFERLPATSQRAMLEDAVRGWDKGPAKIATMLAAWKSGNVKAMKDDMINDFRSLDGLSDALITARNRRWADWAARRMDSPGTVMIAVGAGHLVGEQSVLTLLQARGMTVTRLQ